MRRGRATIFSLRSQLGAGHPALHRIRLTARFVRGMIFRVPLYGFGGAAGLFAVAFVYSRTTGGEGLLTTMGDSSILIFYLVLGFIGGSLIGVAAAVRDSLDFFERQLPRWFEEVPALGPDPFPTIPIAELRAHHDRALDQILASTVGAVRAPGLVQRAARRRLQDARVEEFLGFCEGRGATEVGFSEVRAWTLTKGLPLLTAPTRRQMSLLRVGVWIALMLLAVLPFVLSAIVR